MKQYLHPSWQGIDTLERYISGIAAYWHNAGMGALRADGLPGAVTWEKAAMQIREQIDSGILVPFLLLYHKNNVFKDFQWHWFNLAGYEEFEDEFYVKAVTYGGFYWLNLKELWNTGYRRKGGLYAFSCEWVCFYFMINGEKGLKNGGYSYTKRAFYHTLSAMVIPIAFQNLMTALVSASDAVMLGFLEQEALSAVSLAGQVTFVFNLCVTVLVQGTTMLAAQYWGRESGIRLKGYLLFAMRYMALVTVAFLIGTSLFPEHIMSLLTNEAALIIRGAKYLRIAGISYVPFGLSQIYLCIMKNSGKTAKKYGHWFFVHDIKFMF